MPGFDGAGPTGLGPMTGGARGYCAIPLPRVTDRPYSYGSSPPAYFPRPCFGPGTGRGRQGRRGPFFGRCWR